MEAHVANTACSYLRASILTALIFNFAGTRGVKFTYILPALSLSVFLWAYQATFIAPAEPNGEEEV